MRRPTPRISQEESNEDQIDHHLRRRPGQALRFYTQVAGFVKKTDVSQGGYRWLTVASPEDPDGTELHLERNDNPAAKAYQQALFEQGQPAAMFYTDDVKRDYERMKDAAEFKMPPTKVTGSTIAQANDTC